MGTHASVASSCESVKRRRYQDPFESFKQRKDRQVPGRRNWLFVGSDDGGITNARFVSLLASARLHNIEPLSYMRDLLCLLPCWPKSRVLELAPVYWIKTLEQPEAQEQLAANVFRRVLLSPTS